MNYLTVAYLRSTKSPDRHPNNPAAPACFYRTETKRQRRAKDRAQARRQLRALKLSTHGQRAAGY